MKVILAIAPLLIAHVCFAAECPGPAMSDVDDYRISDYKGDLFEVTVGEVQVTNAKPELLSPIISVDTEYGTLHAFDKGEFGGALRYVRADGTTYEYFVDGIRFIAPVGDSFVIGSTFWPENYTNLLVLSNLSDNPTLLLLHAIPTRVSSIAINGSHLRLADHAHVKEWSFDASNYSLSITQCGMT